MGKAWGLAAALALAARPAFAQEAAPGGPPGLRLSKAWHWLGPSDWWEFTARKGQYSRLAFTSLGPALSDAGLESKADGLEDEVRAMGAKTLSEPHALKLAGDQKLVYVHYFIGDSGRRTGYLNLGEKAYKFETTSVSDKDWKTVLKSLRKAAKGGAAAPTEDVAVSTAAVDKAREKATLDNLTLLRWAVGKYSDEHQQQLPSTLDEVIVYIDPYRNKPPLLRLPDHPENTYFEPYGDEVCDGRKLDARKLKDTGRWAYVGDPAARCFGTVFIDCTHLDSQGRAWDSY